MKTTLVWKDAIDCERAAGPHSMLMDAKTSVGKDSRLSPKELVAMGLGGSNTMDIIALMKKHK